jgi:hypothetical protein
MESLLTAYYATGNQKYLDSFLATGNEVLGLVQSLTVLDIPDPSAPGPVQMGPMITVTGWPTSQSVFTGSTSIPAADGQVSFYAQVLRPVYPTSVIITQMSPSGLLLQWQNNGVIQETNKVYTESDLDKIANTPLDYFSSFYRIANTGMGLPAPGSYSIESLLATIWHGEQTGGILLPFIRFLLLAQIRPAVVDPMIVKEWTAQVVSIADSYKDQLVSDGKGGLVITNPFWLPSTEAGLPAPSDYINAEITMRMLLYKLTGDQQELSLARGLLTHEKGNLQTSGAGWLLLKDWPDIHSWSGKDQAPYGSIYDTLTYNNTNEEATVEGSFFVDMLQTAVDYNLLSDMNLQTSLYATQFATFSQYLRIPDMGTRSLVREAYPTPNSGPGDPIVPAMDPFTEAAYLAPATSPGSYVCDNWKWMLANAQGLEQAAGDAGYTLLGWAKSEAAAQRVAGKCPGE